MMNASFSVWTKFALCTFVSGSAIAQARISVATSMAMASSIEQS